MATDAFKIFVGDTADEDTLRQVYATIEGTIAKNSLFARLKTRAENLIGDPQAGSVIVRRMQSAVVKAAGTARTAGAGDPLRNNGTTVNLSNRQEIVEEVDFFDNAQYGVNDLVGKRANDFLVSWETFLDRAFFGEAVSAGTNTVLTSTNIEDKIEELIQAIETTENDNVDGVDRSQIHLTLKPVVYGLLKNKVNTLEDGLFGQEEVVRFNGAFIHSNHRQTKDAIAMREQAIALPVAVKGFGVQQIPLSSQEALSIFFNYGVKAVTSDLVRFADVVATPSV